MAEQRTNKTFWEISACIYGRFMRKNDAGYEGIAQTVVHWVTPNSRVLELACGTGQLTGRLAPLAKKWVATDFSPKMVEHARASVSGPNIVFETADAVNLHYADASFELVLIANALHVMPHPGDALKEIMRVLVPGGIRVAPTFVQAERSAPLTIWLMKKAGLLFHPWHSGEYVQFIASQGFSIASSALIPGSPLDECLVIGKKPAAADEA